jgi:hypothetical protein
MPLIWAVYIIGLTVKTKLLRTLITPAMVLVLGSVLGCPLLPYRFRSASCKQRGATLAARVETLERDARNRLTIGTKKDEVIRFFADNGIPVTFDRNAASGSAHTVGCAPQGCGTDDGFLGLLVKVTAEGTVVSEPVVSGGYTDCL